MYAVSQEFKDKISAQKRKIDAKIIIDYTNPFQDQAVNQVVSEEADISYPQHTSDSILQTAGKIASLDGTWMLDGTWISAPDDEEEYYTQMGWWGRQLAGTGGIFSSPYPSITLSFAPRSVDSLICVGDSAREEYPVDFEIKLYNETDSLLYTEAVTGNTLIEWSKDLTTPQAEVAKIELTITKWSHEGRQAKIIELLTAVQETYEGDEIMSINLLEEREVSQGSLPVGNISANEIDIVLYNKDRKFDAGNTESPIYNLLRANRRIRAYLGITKDDELKEWVPLGTFWSGDWNVPEQGLTASTSGRDRLEQLRNTEYTTSVVEQNKTLYYLAEKVLVDAGLRPEEYTIDTDLQNYTIPWAYLDRMSHREALRIIAEACLGQVYCDREGIIQVKIIDSEVSENIYPELSVDNDLYLWQDDALSVEGFNFVYEYGDIYLDMDQGLTKEVYFEKSNPIKWSKISNKIEVNRFPLTVSNNTEEVYLSEEVDPGVYICNFNKVPCTQASATITSGNVVSEQYYSWGAIIEVDTVGAFTISINAKPLVALGNQKIVRQDDVSMADNGVVLYKFNDNPLIQTRAQAEDIAQRLIDYYSNPRRDITISWRGNPSWLLGDLVAVVDDNEINNYIIAQQSIEYNGGLKAEVGGRRI